MKKIIIASVFVFSFIVGSAYAYQEQQTGGKDYQLAISEADYMIFDDLTEIEKYSQYIILGKFTGNRSLKKWKTEDDVKIASKSEVQIKKVYGGDLAEGQMIDIYEPAFFQDDIFDSMEGYNLMNEEGEYVLFLRGTSDGDAFAIIGMYQGKYDISTSKLARKAQNGEKYQDVADLEYFGDNAKQFNERKQEVLKKYK